MDKPVLHKLLAVLVLFEFFTNVGELASPDWKQFPSPVGGNEGLFRSCSLGVCISYTGNTSGGFAAFFLVISLLLLIASEYYVIMSIYSDCVYRFRKAAYANSLAGVLHFLAVFSYFFGQIHSLYTLSTGFYVSLLHMFIIGVCTYTAWRCSESTEKPLVEYKNKWTIFTRYITSKKNDAVRRFLQMIPSE